MEIINGAPLSEQSQEFQEWFNENIMPQIDFAESCTSRDEFNRPKEWHFEEVRVVAEYYTIEEVPELVLNPNYVYNYNFKQWRVYGTI